MLSFFFFLWKGEITTVPTALWQLIRSNTDHQGANLSSWMYLQRFLSANCATVMIVNLRLFLFIIRNRKLLSQVAFPNLGYSLGSRCNLPHNSPSPSICKAFIPGYRDSSKQPAGHCSRRTSEYPHWLWDGISWLCGPMFEVIHQCLNPRAFPCLLEGRKAGVPLS